MLYVTAATPTVCSQRPWKLLSSSGDITTVSSRQDPITSLIRLLIPSLLFSEGVSGDGQEQMVQAHQSCGHFPASCPLDGPHTEARLEQSNPCVVYAGRWCDGAPSWGPILWKELMLANNYWTVYLLRGGLLHIFTTRDVLSWHVETLDMTFFDLLCWTASMLQGHFGLSANSCTFKMHFCKYLMTFHKYYIAASLTLRTSMLV